MHIIHHCTHQSNQVLTYPFMDTITSWFLYAIELLLHNTQKYPRKMYILKSYLHYKNSPKLIKVSPTKGTLLISLRHDQSNNNHCYWCFTPTCSTKFSCISFNKKKIISQSKKIQYTKSHNSKKDRNSVILSSSPYYL